MNRLFAIAIALMVAGSTAGAQVLPVPRRSGIPAAWVSLSAGFMDLDGVADGSTGTAWDFSNALQYRGSLEMDLANGGGLSLSVGLADVPLRYFAASSSPPAACPTFCDAHAKVWTFLGGLHAGGGVGFHQVIDIGVGAVVYRDFEADDGGDLPPVRPDVDFSFNLGYGFGYGFTPRLQVMIVQDAAYVLHQREGLGGGEDSSAWQRVTRIGLRYGIGSR